MKKTVTNAAGQIVFLDSPVRLSPTEGCYQDPKFAEYIRETKTMIIVKVQHEFKERRFRKSDGFEVKGEFPRYRIELPKDWQI